MSTGLPATRADADRRVTVIADDGVHLAAHTTGPDSAAITVVFVHGHCLRTDSWSYLRDQLRRHWSGETRMVFYDHRGHGESGVADPSTYTIDQLAHDLDAVLRTLAPTGPVILVGHSMGAMVALAYARLFPHTIGTRVMGVGLIAGAAGGITDVGLARFLHPYAVGSLQVAVLRAPRLMQASKRLTRRFFEPIVREAQFGTRKVNPRMAAIATAMLNETPLLTMSSFLASLIAFDESETLHQLAAIPALVLAGTADIVVPYAHSVLLASRMAGAELVRVDGAGHSVILERAEEVAVSLVALLERVRTAAPGTGTPLAAAG